VQKDLAPVAMLTATPFMVVVNPELPVKSIAELIAYAKQHPGKLSYATPGIGTPHHLGTELFKSMTGTSMVHIAYRGGTPALADVISGRVQVMWLTINIAIPQTRAGKVRGLAVAERTRLASMKDMPTVAENLPGYEVSAWYAVFAPSGTPAPIVQQLSAELQRIYSDPDGLERLTPLGYQGAVSGPGPLATTLANDLKKWEKVVRDAGIKPE
jgi:tripartite-type tricarboxylate transporter receptor subunit TctC